METKQIKFKIESGKGKKKDGFIVKLDGTRCPKERGHYMTGNVNQVLMGCIKLHLGLKTFKQHQDFDRAKKEIDYKNRVVRIEI